MPSLAGSRRPSASLAPHANGSVGSGGPMCSRLPHAARFSCRSRAPRQRPPVRETRRVIGHPRRGDPAAGGQACHRGAVPDLSEWWSRLRALLAAEREEERVRFAELRGRLSLREREARGFALADVEALDEAGLAGRALVSYGRADGRALAGRLNPEQECALDLADRAADVALVHGPPGTGKTTVLVEVVRRAVARGESVLAAAPSNLAVDNLLERLLAAGVGGVRVGHPARVLPALLEHTLEAQVAGHEAARIAQDLVREALELRRSARKRKQRRGPGRFSEARVAERDARALLAEARALQARAEREVLSRAPVVLATLGALDGPVLAGRRFTLSVIDEATQAVEPAAYLALLRCERAVLAGDHLQLPPTVLSAAAQQGGLGVSLFERLIALHGDAVKVTLAEQHRMHEAIMRFPSDALYGGALRAHPAVAGRALDAAPLEVVDTSGRGFEESTPEGSDSKQRVGKECRSRW